jgi:hypothetical protein
MGAALACFLSISSSSSSSSIISRLGEGGLAALLVYWRDGVGGDTAGLDVYDSGESERPKYEDRLLDGVRIGDDARSPMNSYPLPDSILVIGCVGFWTLDDLFLPMPSHDS